MSRRTSTPPATGFEGVPTHVLEAWRKAHAPTLRADPGPEWLTTTQLAAVWSVSEPVVRARVKKLRLAGRVDKSLRDIIDASGRAFPVPVYRIREAP